MPSRNDRSAPSPSPPSTRPTCTRSPRCRRSTRSSPATSRTRSCRPSASSASASCPTPRWVAAAKGCTPGQLALAWVLAQGDDIAPIPGTKRVRYLEENVGAADVVLTGDDLAALEAAVPRDAVVGDRYGNMAHIDA